MSDDMFELPDMDDLAKQMEDAMSQAKKAMGNIPGQESFADILGSLSSVMEDLPDQMGDLGEALGAFGEMHQENVQSAAGEPNWSLEAVISIGSILKLKVVAAFDFDKVLQAWESTQRDDFESVIKQTVAENTDDVDDDMMSQIVEQLKMGGRSMALVNNIDVLECSIQGAPGNAAASLKLSPEANIPLVMNEDGIGFEFAPMLTIKNQWENANIPAFTPMGEKTVVPVDEFENNETFEIVFDVSGQEKPLNIEMKFSPV